MSNIVTGAERSPHDMSHFVYTCGAIGALKVISYQNLIAGDSLEMNTVGSFRLSPLKRGLALDTCLELFTFYVPYRHIYGDAWVNMMKDGISSETILPVEPYSEHAGYNVRFLGTRRNHSYTVPKWLLQGYYQIYNNYFKRPWSPDYAPAIGDLPASYRRDGIPCNHLKTIWSAPLNPDTPLSSHLNVPVSGTSGSLDIMNLDRAYGQLHTVQERDYFMLRYRDVIESFGGRTTIDADNRPQLLMRSKFWASGYDVDGTDQSSLGQFAGRVQQTFNHKLPRWYCPEHGVVMTLALARFPPIVHNEVNYFVGNESITYPLIAGDPAIVGNIPPHEMQIWHVVPGVTGKLKVPHSQWYRVHNNHVDEAYDDIGSFPFCELQSLAQPEANMRIFPDHYDKCFQSLQLKHWNIQCKFNDTVYRRLPSARDSIMTS